MHKGPVYSVTFTADDKYIVSGSHDQTIAIWDIEEKRLIHQFQNAHQGGINSVVVTSDDKQLVSGSRDKSIAIWDFQCKKLIHRIENAHQGNIWAVAVTEDINYIVSAAEDISIGIWGMKNKNLVHRFKNAHLTIIFSIVVTKDSRYIVSGSGDQTVAIWDIEEKKLIHQFKNVFPSWVLTVAVTEDNRYIVAGSYDRKIVRLDIQSPLTKIKDLPLLNSYSKAYSDGLDFKLDMSPAIQDISFLHEMAFLSKNWNFLSFAVFLLPNVHPADYLNFAREHKVYLSLDIHNKTQLHYLLDFPGRRTTVVYKFCSLFFKHMSSFMNYNSLGREKLLKSLAKLTVRIYETQQSASLLGYLKSFVRPAEEIFDKDDFEQLPIQGDLRNGKDQGFIKLKGIGVPSKDEYYSVVSKPESGSEGANNPTLQYDLVLLFSRLSWKFI